MGTNDLNEILLTEKTSTEIARRQRSLLRSVIAYEPIAIQRPHVDKDFGEMSSVESTLEAFRYSAFLLEYTVSSNGWLRAWLVLWGRLFLLLVVPTVAATTLARAAVPLAANLAEISIQLEIAAQAAVSAIGWLAFGVGLVAAIIAGVRWSKRQR